MAIDKILQRVILKKKTMALIRGFLYLSILMLASCQVVAQSRVTGVFFQAVARDNAFNPAKDRKVFVETSIIQTTANGNVLLTEMHQSKTDASGVFSINIGQGTRMVGTAANISSIDWSKGPFFLNVKLSIVPVAPVAGWNYANELVDVGTTSFGAVPYAYYAEKTGSSDLQLNLSDTANMLISYLKSQRFLDSIINLNTRLNLKLNIADTSSMLKGFATISRLIDSLSALKNGLSSKLKIADTAAMLSNRFRRDTANLSDRIEANKKGINDSVLSIRSSLGIVKLAIQYVDEKNKNAIIDTSRSIRSELSDTANALRSYVGGDLSDTVNVLRTALSDTASALRSSLSLTQSEMGSDLADSADHIRTVLLDSASAIRDALLDSSEGIRMALLDSAGDIRSAILDSASNLRSNVNLKVNISDTALMLSNRFARDTVSLSTRIIAANNRVADSSSNLNSRINLKVSIADTSDMLVPYLRKTDTSAMLSNRFARDTFSLSNRIVAANNGVTDSSSNLNSRINLKVSIADTSNMLNPYLRKADTSSLSSRINLKLLASDTSSLSTRINLKLSAIDTSTLSNRIDTKATISANLNDQTSTTYTVLATDNGKVITFDNASAIILTVPTGLSAGFNCMIVQKGAGEVTISGAGGITVTNRNSFTKTAGQNAIVSLIGLSATYFITGGDMQ